MNSDDTPFTAAEIQRLADAGIRYPWTPRQSLRLLDENARLREALEEIEGGVGCNARYGPGCDHHCKDIARAALKG